MAKQPMDKLERTEAAIKRWETKLTRAMRQLSKLRLQRMRLKKKTAFEAAAIPAKPEPVDLKVKQPEVVETKAGFADTKKPVFVADDLDPPAFLDRRSPPDETAQQIAAEIAEKKKRKSHARIERMKAEKRGDLKKMPLSGKAALAAIRESS